eukprot:s4059_g1.t1
MRELCDLGQSNLMASLPMQPTSVRGPMLVRGRRNIPTFEDGDTTVMLRRLPLDLGTPALLEILDQVAPRLYDLVYVPFDRRRKVHIALAWVNFTTPEIARQSASTLSQLLSSDPEWNVEVRPANVQGRDANLAYFIARFGTTALAKPHAPLVFANGNAVADRLAFVRHTVSPSLLREAADLVAAERPVQSRNGCTRRAQGFIWRPSASAAPEDQHWQLPAHAATGLAGSTGNGWNWRLLPPGESNRQYSPYAGPGQDASAFAVSDNRDITGVVFSL